MEEPIRPKDELAKAIHQFEANHFPNIESGKYIQELHHIDLPVSNLKRSIDFYRDILDLHLIQRARFHFGGAWFGLPNGQHLHLVEHESFTPLDYKLPVHGDFKTPPTIHFAFRVDEKKFQPYIARVTGKLSPERFINQPFPDIPICQLYLLDLDGYMIEITNITPEQKQPKYIDKEEWYDYAYWWK